MGLDSSCYGLQIRGDNASRFISHGSLSGFRRLRDFCFSSPTRPTYDTSQSPGSLQLKLRLPLRRKFRCASPGIRWSRECSTGSWQLRC
jgi:hypothetical protein